MKITQAILAAAIVLSGCSEAFLEKPQIVEKPQQAINDPPTPVI